jgi:hypothetical protein
MEFMPFFHFAILVDVPMFKQNAKHFAACLNMRKQTFCSMLKREETSVF